MSYRVIIQPNAEAELDAAYLYRSTRVPQAAARWFAEFVEAINSLAEFPERCPFAPENGHFLEEIRQPLYGTRRDAFRILFTIQDDTVHVLHIRHGAQRYLHEDET
jgi:plasmid stabilization system protein ParE